MKFETRFAQKEMSSCVVTLKEYQLDSDDEDASRIGMKRTTENGLSEKGFN